MAFAGIAVTVLGFVIAASSPGLISGNGGRLIVTVAGIAVSLYGIIGMLNPTFQKNAVWRK
jgi:hypothetical protein